MAEKHPAARERREHLILPRAVLFALVFCGLTRTGTAKLSIMFFLKMECFECPARYLHAEQYYQVTE